MRQYRRDPGAFRIETMTGPRGQRIVLLNALAANDPESSERILDQVEQQGPGLGNAAVAGQQSP